MILEIITTDAIQNTDSIIRSVTNRANGINARSSPPSYIQILGVGT